MSGNSNYNVTCFLNIYHKQYYHLVLQYRNGAAGENTVAAQTTSNGGIVYVFLRIWQTADTTTALPLVIIQSLGTAFLLPNSVLKVMHQLFILMFQTIARYFIYLVFSYIHIARHFLIKIHSNVVREEYIYMI